VEVERFEKSPVGRLVPITGHDSLLDLDYRHFAFVPDPAPSVVNLSQATYKAASTRNSCLCRKDSCS
jgi:hypothetical protein